MEEETMEQFGCKQLLDDSQTLGQWKLVQVVVQEKNRPLDCHLVVKAFFKHDKDLVEAFEFEVCGEVFALL